MKLFLGDPRLGHELSVCKATKVKFKAHE
jgi:hypothetical protein